MWEVRQARRRRGRPSAVVPAVVLVIALASPAPARAPGDPVRLVWDEGDLAGLSTIYGRDGAGPIGFVEYRQTRREDVLSSVRVARFRDGSSDEDAVTARVGECLEALSGRSVIRDTRGEVVVDISVDVPAGRIEGAWRRGAEWRRVERRVELPAGTYWGPLIFIVLKNFDANEEGGRLVFRTVAATPRPRVLDMEIRREGPAPIERTGVHLEAVRFDLAPTIPWVPDLLVRLVAPDARFYMLDQDPPALARFAGPRNYGRQEIRIE
jgi:hypothetical protein